jgi:hypothetical protein
VDAVPTEERVDFPAVGARARQLKRFERDLAAWLDTPAGRFAVFSARRPSGRGGAVGAEAADHDLRPVGREAR